MNHNRTRARVVIYTTEVLGETMAGPGIRALRMAEAVSPFADVVLVSEVRADLTSTAFEIVRAGGDELLAIIESSDVLVLQSPLLTMLPELQRSPVHIVSDLYDPFLFEQLQQGTYLESDGQSTEFIVRAVNDMVRFADYMVCASEKQRDLWLGQLASQGRLNPATYRADPSLRNLIDVVPFGVDDAAPVQTSHAIRGTVPGIGADDTVLLWGGGIYDWFDPLTLIRAVGALSERRPDLRLVFLATAHANPEIGTMQMATESRELAAELGILGSHVFFNEQWVPHAERANWFLDADLGVSTHLDHLETAFSFRTRLLDYLWAGLPIVNTAGDAFETVIRDRGLGAVVPPGDVDALVAALDTLLGDDEAMNAAAANAQVVAAELSWSNALAPLVAYCAAPWAASDAPRSGRGIHSSVGDGDLARELAAMRASSSWRVTAPLRALSQTIGRLRGR